LINKVVINFVILIENIFKINIDAPFLTEITTLTDIDFDELIDFL